MSNNANRFVTVKERRRMAADECTRVRACDKVGGAGKHLLKAARQAGRTGEQIQRLLQRAEGLRLRDEFAGIIPANFHAATYPNITQMLKDGGKQMVVPYVTAPEKGCGSPSNALSELEEFLRCHSGMKWWKIPKSAWRAHRWYASNVRCTIHATPKFWENLGKISANVRWAAIYLPPSRLRSDDLMAGWKDYSSKLPWSHRDLKWEEVKKASRGMRSAAHYVPEWRKGVVWNWRFHAIYSTDWPAGHWPWNFGPGLEDLVAAAKSQDPWLRRDSQLDAACRLCYWLGDLATAETLWRRLDMEVWQEGLTARHLHDLAQRFPLRRPAKWWRQIIMAAPAQSRPYLRVSEAVEAAVKAGEAIPKSMADLRTLCARVGILVPSAGDLTSVEEDFISTTVPKKWEEIPSIDEVVDGIRLTKVAANDPLALTVGRLVNCCQHLEGAAASAAAECWTNPAVGVYVAKKGDMVVGQAMVWRGAVGWDGEEGGTLVLDSIECLSGHEAAVAKAFVSAAPQMLHRGLGIRKVVVGNTDYGCTEEVHKHCGSVQHPPPQPYDGYTDAHRVRPLIKITKKGEIKRYG